MKKAFSLQYSLETLCALLALLAFAAVLQSFIIGKHFIIPTGWLTLALFLGNVARFGYRDAPWAKHVAFWLGVLLTCHWFMALFWAQALRRMLGGVFEPVALVITLVLAFLTWQYWRRNPLLR
ncbi:MAG: hypothetical protein U5K76_03965 [Woeseiaceae bacterium]|nr:hypothetical protein [Woeseiaceae bacterium]